MQVFVARQPIFDREGKVYAYELLYRDGLVNTYTGKNADQASSNVMLNSFDLIGLEELTDGKRAFINFTGELIRQGVATLFPSKQLVVEVLETVAPEKEVIDSLMELKKKGYMLALDDFVFQEAYQPLIQMADIIKVDFMATSPEDRWKLVRRLSNGRLKFLAEKIETREDFEEARRYGYTFFQGYFFSKPIILSAQDIPALKLNYLQMIQKANDPEMDFGSLSDIIIRDVSLSFKLLKLVNSAALALRSKVQSIKHALVILGSREIRKWISLIALKGIVSDPSDEILHLSLIRAKFCENLSRCAGAESKSQDLFLTGLFSALDVLMGRPLQEILEKMTLPEGVKEALMDQTGAYGRIYQMCLCYERADWEAVNSLKADSEFPCGDISAAYLDAISWVSKLDQEA